MNKKVIYTKKRKYRTVLIIVGIFITILCAALFYIGLRWKPILRNTIEKTVLDVSDSLYHAKFSDISINLFTGSVYLSGIELIADSAVYSDMIKKGIAPENVFHLKIKQLDIKSIRPFKVYLKRALDINDIIIREPELTVTYTRLRNKKHIDKRSTYEKIKNTLKSAKLSQLTLNEIAFTYIDKSLKTPDITKVDRLNIRVSDILIDSLSQYDTTRFFHSKNIIAELNDFSYPTADSLYHINIGKLSLSTDQKKLVVNNMEVSPRYEEMAFSNLFERQQDRYKLHFDSIILDSINYPALIDYRTVTAKKLTLNNGEVSVFLNRAKPKKSIDKGRNYPHMALKRVNWDVNADTIIIKKTNIHYSEYMPNTNSTGTVSFYNLNGRIFNATNDSALLAKNRFIDAYMQTAFMGKGDLNVHIRFDMFDEQGAFTYKGSLKKMPLQALNPISKPLAKVMFNSGEIDHVDFSVRGNLKGGGGMVTIAYNKLNIILMKKNSGTENFKKMGLISLLANALLIKEDNPSKGEKIRVTYPYYTRPHDASFFNLMWKVIFIGFKETIGITKEKEAEIQDKSEKFKERQERREARKLRRQQRRENND